jgi:C4-type Zn-finger protein
MPRLALSGRSLLLIFYPRPVLSCTCEAFFIRLCCAHCIQAFLVLENGEMTCPICKSRDARRSRRQDATDYLLSVAGVYPWRCQSCHGRFHGRLMPLSDSLRAHCPVCRNVEVKRIAAEHVVTPLGFVWRFLRIPAYRCEPCRHKYFSLRPLRTEKHVEVEQLTTAD